MHIAPDSLNTCSPALGTWEDPVALDWSEGDVWTGELEMPVGVSGGGSTGDGGAVAAVTGLLLMLLLLMHRPEHEAPACASCGT